VSSVTSDTSLLPVYHIHPLPLVSFVQDLGSFTYGFNLGTKFDLPVFSWYIAGGNERILVDTGADAYHAKMYRGFEALDIYTFEDALLRYGLKPADIDVVIQTHLMWDHCVHTRKCTNARVIVQQDELEYAVAPHPIQAMMYRRELFMGLILQLVNGHTEILPGIELIPTPGHCPGCMSVGVNTEKGRAVISGMCAVDENFNPPLGVREYMPVIPPGIHLDAVEAFNSALKIKGMADILIASHDPALVNVETIPD